MTCKGCTKRHEGCHGKCEDYAKSVEEYRRIAKLKRDDDQATAYLADRNKQRIAYEARKTYSAKGR